MVATFISSDVTQFPAPAAEQGKPILEGWHVVQVRTSMEQKTCDAIRVSGWTAYCPMETKWRKPRPHETQKRLSRLRDRRSAAIEAAEAITIAGNRERALAAALRIPRVTSIGRMGEVENTQAFFPGYLFVASERGRPLVTIRESQHQPGIEGVIDILQNADGTFARIPHRVIDALMAAETMGALVLHGRPSRRPRDITKMFTGGEPVRVVGGPLDSFVGSVVRCAPNGRIKLVLDAFGVAEVEADQVERLTGA